MKYRFTLLIIVFNLFLLRGQSISFQWARDWGHVEVRDIKVDSLGNSVLTGNFWGTVDFDPSPSTFNLTAFGSKDIFICKLDASGSLMWARALNCTNNQQYNAVGCGNSIDLTPVNEVLVTGYFTDTVDFNPGSGTYMLMADSLKDVFVLKLDANGNFLWAKAIGATDDDQGTAIKADKNGNVYVSGEFRSSIDFDPGPGQYLLNSNFANGGYFYTDVFVLKLDGAGNFSWAKNIGGNSSVTNIFCTSLDVDVSQNVYFTGSMLGLVDFDPGPGFLLQGNAFSSSIYICKLNSGGGLAWAKTVSASNSMDIALNRKNGNVYITGDYTGTVDFDPGPGYVAYNSAPGFKNIFLLKLDSLGNYKWSGEMGGLFGSGTGNAIKIDDIGNVFIGGRFAGSTDFDPNAGSQVVAAVGNTDLFVCKLDTADRFLWMRSVGSTWPESVARIGLDGYGAVYSVGYFTINAFNLSLDFDPGPGQYLLTNGDSFSWKLSPCTQIPASISNTSVFHGYNCPGISYTLSAQSSDSIFWYSSLTSTLSLGSGQSFVTPVLNSGVHTFYAEVSTCTLSLTRIPVSVSILPSPTIVATSTSVCAGQSATMTVYGATSYTWSTGSTTPSVSISPTANTIYSVATENIANGCSSTIVQNIAIKAPPSVIIFGSSQICTGGMAQLFASGASTYTWIPSISSGQPLYPTSSETYTVYGTGANSCTNSAVHTLTVNPFPTVTLNSGTVCIGSQFVLTPGGASSYSLSSGTPTVSPQSTSFYYVTGELNGCTSVAQSTVTVMPPPNLNVLQFTSEVCVGGTGVAVLTGATSYSLTDGFFSLSNSTGTFSFMPTAAGSYTMSGSDAYGCSKSLTNALNMFVVPSLSVSSNPTICVGSGTTINAAGAGLIIWNGTYLDSMMVHPVSSTTYSVIGCDLSNYTRNCADTAYVTVTVNQTCQDVWPGDANSDGVADNLDVLELGLHFAQSGPARGTISNSWQSYFANNWAGTISNGKNMNHSDCNGDGTINSNDTLAIYNNYGLTHAFKPTEQTVVNPQLSIVPDQSAVAKGNWGTSSVFLGEASAPVNNINGLAFSVTFDQSLIDANSFYIEYPASFINAGNQNLKFSKPDFTNGKLYTATTHTLTNNVSGNGRVAVLHYKIKSTLATDEVLSLGISQVRQSGANGQLTPLTAGSATIAAIGASVGVEELLEGKVVALYPNPASSSATIQSNSQLQKVELLSLTGQVIFSEPASGSQHQLNLETLSNGVYVVNIYSTGQNVVRKKLVVQH